MASPLPSIVISPANEQSVANPVCPLCLNDTFEAGLMYSESINGQNLPPQSTFASSLSSANIRGAAFPGPLNLLSYYSGSSAKPCEV
jgi:hypothetical protein